MRLILILISSFFGLLTQGQRIYHVSVSGNDRNNGAASTPLRSISAAASLAMPGDTITVHAGVYRERIDPPRGGISNTKRIVYQASPGEKVEIRGSEIARSWRKIGHDTWEAVIPNSRFGKFNPYSDLIHGDWFEGGNRSHHTGEVYLDGGALREAANKEDVLQPATDTALWFGQVMGDSTKIWAQFRNTDPNSHEVEINARQTIFYPEKTGINYITVRGFIMKQAATPWAPPTAEQIGLIGAHWSKGWIIENNIISYAKNAGIALGKYGDEWDNKAGTAEGYVGTIKRALQNGWNGANIGHHIVRNNHISYCGQAGIVGSLGAIFSIISYNEIHDVNVHQQYTGAEVAGIKIHGAIDVEISHNHIFNNIRGIWLDWMAQGTYVEANLCHDNRLHDIYMEVDHGPFFINNNIFLSDVAMFDRSEGGAFTHNIVNGKIRGGGREERNTPYFKPHSTELVDIVDLEGGDMRIYNNLFARTDVLDVFNTAKPPIVKEGNIFLNGKIEWRSKEGKVFLELPVISDSGSHPLVTTALLGKTVRVQQDFELPDGSPVRVTTDYYRHRRNERNPFPGALEISNTAREYLQVWPIKTK